MRRPTAVQAHCISKILEGRDVLGLAQTGSGKTVAFALPILQRLAEDPCGVLALVVTPTRELAEQFRALGSCLHLRCEVVVGGMNMSSQAQKLLGRPHVVIATPVGLRFCLWRILTSLPCFRKPRNCHRLSLLLEELDQEAVALHSFKSHSLRLSALHRFKLGQASILLATDVPSRGLDIPTVDLVVNYDIPRNLRDYAHRVGRTARAGRGGLSVSFIT